MRILTLFFNYSGFPCSEGGVQGFGGLWRQLVIEKMVSKDQELLVVFLCQGVRYSGVSLYSVTKRAELS